MLNKVLPYLTLPYASYTWSKSTDGNFNEIVSNDSHRLHSLLPAHNMNDFSPRNKHKFNANFRTERHKKSFIVHNSLKV